MDTVQQATGPAGIYGRPVSTWVQHRVLGVDAARGAALLGMMAVHIVPAVTPDGEVSLAFRLAAGRSSALFAVLAGVGLALLTRWTPTTTARRRVHDRVAVATRALLLVAIGLALGMLDSGVAVILVYYGVLFVLTLPFLGLSSRALAACSAGIAIVVPVLSHLLRPSLPPASYAVPTLDFFDRSLWAALSELTLTGYYPALPWLAYLLAGLAIGKLPLRSPRVARGLLGGGLALTIASTLTSHVLVSRLGGLSALEGQHPEVLGQPLSTALSAGLLGTTPTGSWWWLTVATPHTATPFDLAATIGSSMAVLGLFLLVLSRPRLWASPLVAVGAMSLTLYSLHVVLLDDWLPPSLPHAYWWHVLVATTVAMAWRRFVGQGPLEFLTQRAARGVSTLLVPLHAADRGGSDPRHQAGPAGPVVLR